MSLVTPEKIRTLQKKLYLIAKQEPKRRFHQLYDKVWRRDFLEHAYRLAKSNGGSAGVDGETFADVEAKGLVEWIDGLQEELRAKTYKPVPVRRVLIPKPGGGERPLGIPTIRDRVVQTAAKLILEPIFEADFEDCAYGYRPGRSAQQAVEEIHKALCEGYTDVVDADLSKYFDTVPHHELMQSVARRVVDRQLLKLIKVWLKAPVEERDESGKRRLSGGKKSKRGTPQGGVISPLLANVYIHRYLRGWRERGKGEEFEARIVNYADDFVILSKGRAEEAKAWTNWAMDNLKLTLNETKTKVVDARREPFDFLGYTFGPERYRKTGHWYLSAKPSKKAMQRLKEKIRGQLRPGNMKPFAEVVGQLNRTLRGWANYFCYGTRFMAYRAVDNFVYQRVLGFLQRRHKVSGRGTGRFPREWVHGEGGVLLLRTLHVGAPAWALK